jgi:hypothetical protein
LPIADGTYDVVLTAIGAMFAPDHDRTARELMRVCRPGGVIAMANWTPGEAGRFFAILAPYAPPNPGPAPTAWGDPATVTSLLAPATVRTTSQLRLAFTGTPTELVAHYRAHFPPLWATFAGLGEGQAAQLEAELVYLFEGGYDLEYLTVCAITPRTDARSAAATGRSG